MKVLDLTFASPYHNIACDEALLLECESGAGEPVLRFWEPETPVVVIGRSNKIKTEADLEACQRLGVPVARRSSGGGAIVNGPGCLNYALVLPMDDDGPLAKIDRTYEYVLERNLNALRDLTGARLQRSGVSDLTAGGLKFSGNSQRRKRRFVLFHGTLLLNFALPIVETLLPMPSDQPAYRNHRPHRDFIVNLPVPAPRIKKRMMEEWNAREPLETVPLSRIDELAEKQFSQDEWIYQF
ncbi:MAG: lipoate--protein ligase family protein [bacterium]|nr:lipoate--protein ligase family protein [bacterium]